MYCVEGVTRLVNGVCLNIVREWQQAELRREKESKREHPNLTKIANMEYLLKNIEKEIRLSPYFAVLNLDKEAVIRGLQKGEWKKNGRL